MSAQLCGVCGEKYGKYRCANCRIVKYCSVTCCNDHRTAGCQSNRPEQQTPVTTQPDLLSDEQLQNLARSESLRSALRDQPDLRTALRAIDSATNPGQQLRIEMQNDHFQHFAQLCLAQVEGIALEEDSTEILRKLLVEKLDR